MNLDKIKKYWFIFFTLITIFISIVAILWIWEILESETAWKGVFTLLIINFSVLVSIVVWEKLFYR